MLGDVKDEQLTYHATRAGALQRRLSQSYLIGVENVPSAGTALWEHVWKVSMCKIVFKLHIQGSRVRIDDGKGAFYDYGPTCHHLCINEALVRRTRLPSVRRTSLPSGSLVGRI